MKDKKTPYIVNIAVFAAVIAVAGPLLIFAPRETVSETERRELERFPEFSWNALFSGGYTRQIAVYFSDTAPMRDKITETSAFLKDMAGVRVDGVKLHNVVITDNPDPVPSETSAPPETAKTSAPDETAKTPAPEQGEPDREPGWDGVIPEYDNEIDAVADIANNGILVYETRGLMLFGGSHAAGERYAAALNAYKRRLEGVDIYNMVIPTSVEFYCPKNYRGLSGDQRDNINHIYSFLDGVIPVNAYSALAERAGGDIYLRTDHHWAPLGAYYAAEEFCKTAGVPFAPLSEYEKVVIEGYVGTMYGYSGDIRLKNNPEDFVYYKPPNSYDVTYYNYDDPETAVKSTLFIPQSVGMSYCVFMGGDAKITHISTDVKNGRKLAVFKESYGNALIPFLTGAFEEIYVIDIRYFPYEAVGYLTERGVTDVLFANNVFAANTGSMIAYIEDIM
ncbi:MAG: hypothetical protein LBI38_03700 [Oscillospiraceae bacterium]|jgi:hypothetical protein|nr:hypothetical protein [Oscillospiraceae bacterium]